MFNFSFGVGATLRIPLAGAKHHRAVRATITAYLLLSGTVSGLGQSSEPHIGYVYPAGACRGTQVIVTVAGQFLDGVTNAYVSGKDVSTKLLEYVKPMSQSEFNTLRDKLVELRERKRAALRTGRRSSAPQPSNTNQWTIQDEQMLEEILEKLIKRAPNRQATPALAETVRIELTVREDAQPGEREIRLLTRNGLTNPVKFHVGYLPEATKPHSTPPNPSLNRFLERVPRVGRTTDDEQQTRISFPTVVNGQILPGSIDRYRFNARRGQQLVFVVSARALIPYLADAVPGWFQPTLTVYDLQGRELLYCDDFRFSPDPVLFFEAPYTGDYVLEIKDALFRGREDFVYRITAGELPFITGIFPLGGKTGEVTSVELLGWNLPVKTLPRTNSSLPNPSEAIYVVAESHVSNVVPFDVDDLPEIFDQEPNDSPDSAQMASTPVIVNGRMDKPGDKDRFVFTGQAGEKVVVEVRSRRLNSPMDALVEIRDASGRLIASNDDFPDKGYGLITHQADSYTTAVLPADGKYLVTIIDTQGRGGPEYGYRLRISCPRPDFDLRVVPSSINVRAGACIPVTVYALRKDGFDGDITLRLGGEPNGFGLCGARIPAGCDRVRVTLAAPPEPLREPKALRIEGLAIIGGKPVARSAVPADDMMQAFAFRHLVPAHELQVAVTGRAAFRTPTVNPGPVPWKIPLGGVMRARLDLQTRGLAGRFQLELDDPPEGIELTSFGFSGANAEIELRCDKTKTTPGLKGNLIFRVLSVAQQSQQRQQTNRPRYVVGYLPAVPFEVVQETAPPAP